MIVGLLKIGKSSFSQYFEAIRWCVLIHTSYYQDKFKTGHKWFSLAGEDYMIFSSLVMSCGMS